MSTVSEDECGPVEDWECGDELDEEHMQTFVEEN